MKFTESRPLADPDVAAKLIEIANAVEAVQDGRIFIERVNAPFLAGGGSADQFRAGIERHRRGLEASKLISPASQLLARQRSPVQL